MHITRIPLPGLAAEAALYDGYARVERSISLLAAARRGTKGTLPLAAAEAAMDDIEDHFEIIRAKLATALGVYERAIECLETV